MPKLDCIHRWSAYGSWNDSAKPDDQNCGVSCSPLEGNRDTLIFSGDDEPSLRVGT